MPDADIPATAGAFTAILSAFTAALKDHGASIADSGAELAMTLYSLQIMKAMAEFGLSKVNWTRAVATLLGAAFWYGAVRNSVELADGWMQMFGSIGASSGNGTGAVLSDPSKIVDLGIKSIQGMGRATDQMNIFAAAGVLFLMSLVVILTLIAFTVMGGIAVFIVILGYVSVTVGLVLVPFAIEPGLRWLAAPGLSLIVNAGITLGITSMTLSVGYGAMQKLQTLPPGAVWTIGPAMNVMMGAFVVATLSGGSLIVGILAGGRIGKMVSAAHSAV